MLQPGAKAPSFSLQNQDGEEFNLTDMIGKKKMVIYFYPKNETPGCTKEACSFRDSYEDFVEAGAEVIGISGDSIQSHQKFIANRRLPYTLLSDPGKKIHKLYGVGSMLFGLLSERITYVIDKEGIIRHAFNSQGNINRHVNDALKVLQELN